MTLTQAIVEAENGNFISHESFNRNQSMHMWKHTLYYEDGANLTHHMSWLYLQEWAKDGWYIKYKEENIDLEKLELMHVKNQGCMLQGCSYEDCAK